MLKVLLDYPSPAEEVTVVERSLESPAEVLPILSAEGLAALQALAREVYVDRALVDYAVTLTSATRHPDGYGLPAQALHLLRGQPARLDQPDARRPSARPRARRRYALPNDVRDLALDVLRHRVVLSFQSLAEEVTPDMVLGRVLASIPVPHLELTEAQRSA